MAESWLGQAPQPSGVQLGRGSAPGAASASRRPFDQRRKVQVLQQLFSGHIIRVQATSGENRTVCSTLFSTLSAAAAGAGWGALKPTETGGPALGLPAAGLAAVGSFAQARRSRGRRSGRRLRMEGSGSVARLTAQGPSKKGVLPSAAQAVASMVPLPVPRASEPPPVMG